LFARLHCSFRFRPSSGSLTLGGLKCEYRVQPARPRHDQAPPELAARFKGTRPKQTAYQILAATTRTRWPKAPATCGTAVKSHPLSPSTSSMAASRCIRASASIGRCASGTARPRLRLQHAGLVGDGFAGASDWRAAWVTRQRVASRPEQQMFEDDPHRCCGRSSCSRRRFAAPPSM